MKDKDLETWVKALRSGEYNQAKFCLHMVKDGNESYCCLGVMINELVDDDWQLDDYDYDVQLWGVMGGFELPADDILKKLSLSSDLVNIIASKNDNGKSFEEIANFIDENRKEFLHEK